MDFFLESKLLSGADYNLDGLIIKNYNLDYLFNIMGLETYFAYVHLVKLDKNELKKDGFTDDEIDYYVMCHTIAFLETFLKCYEVKYNRQLNMYMVYLEEYSEEFIWVDNIKLKKIYDIFKQMYCISDNVEEKEELIFASDEAERALLEWEMEEKKRNEKKSNSHKGELTLNSMISYVSAKSKTLSIINIWEIKMYQLHEEYRRLNAIDNYENHILGIYTRYIDSKNIKLDKIRPDVCLL